MRPLLYLEPVGGIAGDMFLALALDLGVDAAALREGLSGLGVSGWEFKVSRQERHAITGTHLEVRLLEPLGDAPHHDHHHRAHADIEKLIRAATTLPDRAKARALATFRVLGEAEAKIHGVPLESIHFHEVGAVDSIVDICGAALALELLGDPEVFSAPPPLGSGMVKTAHGLIPVPAPATLEILRDVAVRFEGVGELTTPTGAALLKTLATVSPPPPLTVRRVGYGLGTKDFKDRANVLRGSLAERTLKSDAFFELSANVDDSSPQLLGHLFETLLEAGALDVYVAPVVMKKGRPGHLLNVLVPASVKARVVETLFRECTTLGVREHEVGRQMLERRFEQVQTPYGPVNVKVGHRGGEVFNAQPEYEDCKRLGALKGVPVKEVMAAAIAAYHSASTSTPTR